MIKKISLLICILLIAPLLFSLDYQPLTDSPGSTIPGGQPATAAATTNNKIDNLTMQMALTQGQINTLNNKIDVLPKVEHLNALGTQLLTKNEAQLNFYLLIFAIMQICFFLMAGSIYFILKGKGRISDIPAQPKVIIQEKKEEIKKEIVAELQPKEAITPTPNNESKSKKGFLGFLKPKRKILGNYEMQDLILNNNLDIKYNAAKIDNILLILKENSEKEKQKTETAAQVVYRKMHKKGRK